MTRGHHMLFVLFVLVVASGCGSARPVSYAAAVCTNWKDDVAPLMASRCSGCHSGDSPAGGYDTTTYIGVLSRRSTLLATIDPASADATHQPVSDVHPELQSWIVDCDSSYFHSSIHPGGWVDPEHPEFHGAFLEASGWSFSVCKGCHGDDFSGGKSNVSCKSCHTEKDGPTGCTTCHDQPPATGAHVTHVGGGALGKKFDCSECHIKPMVYTDVGHLFDAGGSVIAGPARINFGALASASLEGDPRPGPPTWSHDSGVCSNVYCHGGAFTDARAKNTTPTWSHVGQGDAACGNCHGLPPADHAPTATQCSRCHSGVVGPDGKIVDAARHIGGKLVLGDGSGGCSACHGGSANAAPPRDVSGNVDRSAVGVGAHQAHLGAHRLRGPIECHECHVVPASVTDPGHLDHPLPAIVFPAGAPTLAAVDGATPAWDHARAECSNVYCHGGGTRLASDTTSGLHRTPLWTGDSGEAACGTCHGVPPHDGNHSPALPLSACVGCHAGTVDATGQILVVGGQSKHINGVVDVQ